MSITRSLLGGAGLMTALAPALAGTAHAQASATVPRGYLVVANQQSADASIVALPAGSGTRVTVGTGPHEAAIAPGGAWGVVTVYGTKESVGAQLALIDLASGTLVRHVELGEYTRPHAVVPLPGAGRRVLATSESTGNVVIVDLDAGRVEGVIPTGAAGSHMVVATADGRRAFTANIPEGSVSEIDPVERRLVRTIPVGQQVTEGIAVTPDGREVWVGSNASGVVSVVDTREGKVVATITGFRVPYRLAISADGRTAGIVDPQTGSLHLLDVATRSTTASVDLGASPRGVTFSPDGRTAFATVVEPGAAGAVVAVDVASRQVVGRWATGVAPDGLAFHPTGSER
jgi:YVTN family beta-propeller protein